MSAVANNHPNRGAKPCQTPSVEQIRRAQAKAKVIDWAPGRKSYTVRTGLTDKECAELVCVSERTWQNWVASDVPAHREMPAGAWKLFRYEIGLLDPPKKTRS